ncbi:hypothetical protein [Vibrio agarivorans]|uniref:hypothetical protein n=1 Tax=Vibrio agarivorans TaxID=153622 RepID=UPI00222E3BB2|nr:hypothetical protein [Vibrio agarivorans]
MKNFTITKTVAFSVLTTSLISGAAFANTSNVSTDIIQEDAHVSAADGPQQAAMRQAEHQHALEQLERDGNVDRYTETNGVDHSVQRLSSDCENEATPSGAKINEHCE